MKTKTVAWATGRWMWILSALAGLNEIQLSGRHCACPLCGGDNRFRFDDKDGRGTYYCNQCGAGDGMDLLQKINGWEFSRAATEIDDFRQDTGSKAIPDPVFRIEPDMTARRRNLNRLWEQAKSPEVLQHYLVGQRGFPLGVLKMFKDLRGVEKLALYEGRDKVGDFPAMLALIRNAKGRPISIHRTYITNNNTGRVKKIMPPIENIIGAAIRLQPEAPRMVIGEGIETTLAGMITFSLPGWAAITADGLRSLQLPKSPLDSVVILADNDRSFTGQAAAYELARLCMKDGINVTVSHPENAGEDQYDVWRRASHADR